jgi:hypothetical protein
VKKKPPESLQDQAVRAVAESQHLRAELAAGVATAQKYSRRAKAKIEGYREDMAKLMSSSIEKCAKSSDGE